MRLTFKQLCILSLLSIVLIGCRQEQEPTETLVMPLSIFLPANETQTPMNAPAVQRALGDPGTTEQFLLPNYIYIIIMRQESSNWTVWQIIEREVTFEDWRQMRYSGPLSTTGDSIYQYTQEINLLLSSQKIAGRVYAVASAVPLTFNRTLDNSGITNLTNLLTLTFDVAADSVKDYIQHIYTTPYNYELNGEYYGSFNSAFERVPRVNLMLYHVAAKVDLKWNIADTVRIKDNPAEAVRLTYLQPRRLYNGNAYCFMPMRNMLPALPENGDGYDLPNIIQSGDEGLWWEGRSYFYTIPYTVENDKDYFPLQLLMKTNGSEDTGYQLTLKQTIDTTDIFVPWMRGNFILHKPLENKSEIKTTTN